MLYFILRPLTRIALKAYFRRITINGLSNLPKDRPLIICSNHPTGFIEPCLLACFLPRTLHFLVRGDLFEKPLLGAILKSTNQIPIYRFRDGFKKLKDNHKVMNISYSKLAEGHAILIFPEASTVQVKYLRPLQKGAARMALEMLRLHPDKDLAIVPIGINYSNPNRWRSCVTINIGPAINPEPSSQEGNLRKDTVELTQRIERQLGRQLISKPEGVADEVLDKVLMMNAWTEKRGGRIAVKVNDGKSFEKDKILSQRLRSEEPTLHEINISKYQDVSQPQRKFNGLHYLLAIVLIIPVGLILLMNALPVLLGVFIRNKYVRQVEFYAPIVIAASLGAYLIFFVISFLLLLIFYRWWAFLLFLLPSLGLFSLLGLDYLRSIYYTWKLNATLGSTEVEANCKQAINVIEEIAERRI